MNTSMPENVRMADLVEDFSVYPRNQVSDEHIVDLVRALASGAKLPPIVVERSSHRVVDGIHRRRAYIKLLGEDCQALVEWRDYESEAAFFLEATQLNAGHGRKLDRHDQTRVVLRARELKIDDHIIAVTLHVPDSEVRTLAVRIVYDTAGTAVPQKRGLEHLRGMKLSDDQIGAMKSVRSAETGRLCIELTKLLENNLVDLEDELVQQRLKALGKVIALTLKRIRETNSDLVGMAGRELGG